MMFDLSTVSNFQLLLRMRTGKKIANHLPVTLLFSEQQQKKDQQISQWRLYLAPFTTLLFCCFFFNLTYILHTFSFLKCLFSSKGGYLLQLVSFLINCEFCYSNTINSHLFPFFPLQLGLVALNSGVIHFFLTFLK